MDDESHREEGQPQAQLKIGRAPDLLQSRVELVFTLVVWKREKRERSSLIYIYLKSSRPEHGVGDLERLQMPKAQPLSSDSSKDW